MKNYKVFLAMFLALPCFHSCVAASIEPTERDVGPIDYGTYGLTVVVNKNELRCNYSNEVIIGIPPFLPNNEKLDSVGLLISKGENILIDAPMQLMKNRKYLHADTFTGVSFCVDSSILKDVLVRVAYARGDVISTILNISL